MSVPEPTPEAPLPPAVNWFAVWRWGRHWSPARRWTVLLGLLLAGYVFSPFVVIPLVDRLPWAWQLQAVPYLVYYPLQFADEHCPPVHAFYTWGFDTTTGWFDAWLGPLPGTVNAPLPPTPPPPPLPPGS